MSFHFIRFNECETGANWLNVVSDTVSKSEKSGAFVPNGSIFEGVLAIILYFLKVR
jgi:hypothetical protein